MSLLKGRCGTGTPRFAHLPVRLQIEKAAERLADRPSIGTRDLEPWEALVARVDLAMPGTLKGRDLKRALDGVWQDASVEDAIPHLLREGMERDRASLDRAVVHSYLQRFPKPNRYFAALVGATREAARRRDWSWRARGERWGLWEPNDGPRKLALELLASDDPAAVLRDAGLDGEFATGKYVLAAMRTACLSVAAARGAEAIGGGERLIALVGRMKGVDAIDGPLALALLAPWVGSAPPADHQRRVTALLTGRIGDPRIASARWTALAAILRADGIEQPIEPVFAVLKRWLVQATVREFFAVVAKTTDRPDQWKQRTDFWTAYLDAGHISDAWFAFGSAAEHQARRFLKDDSIGYARIEGAGATANQSALLMTLGDLRIAEWSDNGRCRFWNAARPKAPPMYQRIYYAAVLRSMDAERGYEPMSHAGGAWPEHFAKRVHERTGIRHPRYGVGW